MYKKYNQITLFYLYDILFICGAKRSRDSDPFHIKPKTHTEEEEVPEVEWGESKLSGYTAEDDFVLNRPKSRKGEGVAMPEAVPSRIPKEIPNPIG